MPAQGPHSERYSSRPQPTRPLRACLVALVTRLLLPTAYVVFVGFYPVLRFNFGAPAAIAWLAATVILFPTAVVIVLLVLSGRTRSRNRRQTAIVTVRDRSYHS